MACALLFFILPFIVLAAVDVTFYRNGERLPSTPGVVWIVPDDIAALTPKDVLARLARTNPELIDPSAVGKTSILNATGEVITSATDMEVGGDYYLLHSDYLWMWSPVEYGHKVKINPHPDDEGIQHELVVESLSFSPKVFFLRNVVTTEEADAILELNKDRMGVSTVGSKVAKSDIGRTSVNTWDRSSPMAERVIKRVYHMLRIPYHSNSVDGLQVVKYAEGKFYNEHFDFLETSNAHEFNNMIPTKGGTNRYATIFLYLSDVEEGGQTGFPKVDALSDADLGRISPDVAPLVSSHMTEFNRTALEEALGRSGGMEWAMAEKCYTKFAVKPQKLGAVLFYNTLPDLNKDQNAMHSGCPVLAGTKWAANLWVWTGNREGKGIPSNIALTFFNKYPHLVDVKWVNTTLDERVHTGTIQPGHKLPISSFNNHKFEFHYQGKVMDTFHVNFKNGVDQKFSVPGTGEQEPWAQPQVTFQNDANFDIDVYWIPPNGSPPVNQGVVKMHDQILHNTHHTHVFEFQKDGKVLGRHSVNGRRGETYSVLVPSELKLDAHLEL